MDNGQVYWLGQDGNIWFKDNTGKVRNMGKPTGAGGATQIPLRAGLNSKGFDAALGSAEARLISDPNRPASTPTGTGSGSGTAAKTLDTAQLSSLDSLIASLGSIRDQSKSKAAIKRDTNLREKEDEKKREKGKYDTKKLTTLQDFAGAKTDTDLNTRNTLENLVSSLSILGLGGSRALTRQILDAANMSNRKANATQATNNQGLDSAWGEYEVGNENDIKKIQDQFGYDAGEAERKYLQDKQNALYKKADVYNAADRTGEREGVMNEANALNSMIAGAAFMNPQYTGKAREMATPDLSTYTQDIARYDTTGVGTGAAGVTPVNAGASTPGNLAIRAMAVNDKDLGIKKKTESELGYGV